MSTISIKCPNCGGELIFDPKSQKYKCEYCGSDFALDEIETEDTKAQDTSDSAQNPELARKHLNRLLLMMQKRQIRVRLLLCIPAQAVVLRL